MRVTLPAGRAQPGTKIASQTVMKMSETREARSDRAGCDGRGSCRPSFFERRRHRGLLAVLLGPFLISWASAQELASGPSGLTGSVARSRVHRNVVIAEDRAADSFRFRIATSQVLVPVTVTDGGGRPVAGLGPEDFRIFEDGLEQKVNGLLDRTTPLTLAIVVDVSGSMRFKIQESANALGQLLNALGERDRAFLLGFHRWVVNLQEPTYDHALLAEALSRFEPAGGTALFDGVVEGLYRLNKVGPGTRRALIVLSDGFDNASVNTRRETIAASRATGIPIYAVGLGETRRSFLERLSGEPQAVELDENLLRCLAESTGGRAYIVAEMERHTRSSATSPMGLAFERLARELRLQYVLTYRPPARGLDGRWHTIRVELSRADLFARFRPGYLALPLDPSR